MEAKQARPHSELIAQLLDSRIPKTEREHAAAREIERLRADLLQELVDAPEPEPEPEPEPVGEAVDFNGWRIVRWKVKESSFPLGTKFYTAPPAPSVPDEVPDAVIDAVADAIGGAYDCLRVWSAWEYGTMGPDDFLPVTDDADRVAEIARAALSSWLATAPTPAETPVDLARDAEPWKLLLENLVEGLNKTYWSSWQGTAHFDEYLREAISAIERDKLKGQS